MTKGRGNLLPFRVIRLLYEEMEDLKVLKKLTDLLGKPQSTNYEWCNIGEILLYVVQLMESYAAQYRGKPHLQVDGNVSVINGDDKQ